jgi:metal-dependent amidase/aminoacylase/carboxypeptidase family protein
VRAACELVLQFLKIPGNHYDALDHAVVSVGHMEAGTAGNVFPQTARLHGGMRWFKPGGELKIREAMERIARGVGMMYGVECDIEYLACLPPVVNDPGMSGRGRALAQAIPGLTLSRTAEPVIAGDNMAVYLREYPGFYAMLGGGKPGAPAFPHHHEQFDIDENALPKGAALLAQFAADFLQ